MKKLIPAVLISSFIFGAAGIAEAALYTETFLGTTSDSNKVTLNSKQTPSDYATFVFDLTSAGGTAAKDGAVMANALTTDSTTFIANSKISNAVLTLSFGTLPSGAKYSIDLYDIANGVTATKAFDTVTNYAQPISLNSYLSQLSDGKILVKVTNASTAKDKNFDLNQVKLDVTATPVPLPAAGLLLGSGLAGLIGIRRKPAA